MSKQIVVIGAGIIGLSCASALVNYNEQQQQSSRYVVTVVAREFTPNTTSDNVGGLFEPYEAMPRESLYRWSSNTKAELLRLMDKGWPITTTKVKCAVPGGNYSPFWKDLVDEWKEENETRMGHHPVFSYKSLLIETQKYMNKLYSDLKQKVRFVQYEVLTIQGLLQHLNHQVDLVVNCTGLGSKKLFNDPSMFPIRGVLVMLPPQKSLVNQVYLLNSKKDVTHVISREDVCFLGGTVDYDNYNVTATPEEVDAIIKRCCQLVPELTQQQQQPHQSVKDKVVRVWVGLRPGRSAIRLESEMVGSLPLIHCYGHGGSGWTTHWGCAFDVLQLVNQYFHQSKL